MAKVKAKRKKTYKPKKDQFTLKQTEEILKKGGVQALYNTISKMSDLKPYELTMEWDLFDVERIIAIHCLTHGIDLESSQRLPLSVLQSVYKGDLLIAIYDSLIPAKQEFKIHIKNTARNIETGELVPVKDFVMDFTGKPIDYHIFMKGKEEGIYKFKRDGVFDTPWLGITNEWRKFINSQYGDEVELIGAVASLSCKSKFICWNSEKTFKQKVLLSKMRRF